MTTSGDGPDPTPNLETRRRIRRSRAKVVNKSRVQVGRIDRALIELTAQRRAIHELLADVQGRPPATPIDPEDVEVSSKFISRLHAAASRAADPAEVSTTTLERDLMFLTLTADALEDAADR